MLAPGTIAAARNLLKLCPRGESIRRHCSNTSIVNTTSLRLISWLSPYPKGYKTHHGSLRPPCMVWSRFIAHDRRKDHGTHFSIVSYNVGTPSRSVLAAAQETYLMYACNTFQQAYFWSRLVVVIFSISADQQPGDRESRAGLAAYQDPFQNNWLVESQASIGRRPCERCHVCDRPVRFAAPSDQQRARSLTTLISARYLAQVYPHNQPTGQRIASMASQPILDPTCTTSSAALDAHCRCG